MLGQSVATSASRHLGSPTVRLTLSRALAAQVSTGSLSLSLQRLHLVQPHDNHHAASTTSPSTTGRRCYSTSSPSKTWAMTPRRQSTAAAAVEMERSTRGSARPMVNGQQIAFHVNDLLDQPPVQSIRRQQQQQQPKSANQPWTKRSYDSDLIVILDMDECIIHSQFLSTPAAAQVYAHQLKAQQRQMSGSANGGKMVDSFRFSLPDGDLVHVHVRPGLTDFLKAVTDRFETHIFTAAVDVYAKPLLDRLDPTGTMFSGRWYREHCAWDGSQGAYVKDLSRLPIYDSPHRVVLVDNNPMSFLANPSNGILVSSFYNDAEDETLPAVWDLLQELDEVQDVRPVLDERFGLKQALRGVQGNGANDTL